MRVIALDLGTVRIGVAVSDSSETIAFPRPAINRKGLADGDVLNRVRDLMAQEEANHMLIGLPVSLRGKREIAVVNQQSLVDVIMTGVAQLDVEVELVDERLTTKAASRALGEAGMDSRSARQHIDSAAAAVLLQGWLDKRRQVTED
jgi:putative Holliday junction resolvase